MKTRADTSLSDAFYDAVDTAADRPALVQHGSDAFSFQELSRRVNRFANALIDAGIGSDAMRPARLPWESVQDHIALMLPNGHVYLEALLGSFAAGCVPFNVNYRYVSHEVRHLLEDACPRVMVYDLRFEKVVQEAVRDLHAPPLLLSVSNQRVGVGTQPPSYDEFTHAASADRPTRRVDGDARYMIYTGGTTGMPKGALWRQADLLHALMESYQHAPGAPGIAGVPHGERRSLIIAPLMHASAQWRALRCLTTGGTLVLPGTTDTYDPDAVLAAIEAEGVHEVGVIGDTMAVPLCDALSKGRFDVSSLVEIGNGGAILREPTKHRMLELMPHVTIVNHAGSSEVGLVLRSTSVVDDVAAGDTFWPLPATVLLDDTLTKLLPLNRAGEGWLGRADHVPLGYLNDEVKSRRTFVRVGHSRIALTGDRGRVLDGGRMKLLGRGSLVVNSGGEKVFVEEVEEAMAGHPGIAEVAVVGRPSPRWGEEVVAVYARTPEARLDAALLDAYLRDQIASYKRPRAYIEVEALRRTLAGKPDYAWARKIASQETPA